MTDDQHLPDLTELTQPAEDFEERISFPCGCSFEGFTATQTLVFEPCSLGSHCPNYRFFVAECAKAGKEIEVLGVPSGFIVSPEGDTL